LLAALSCCELVLRGTALLAALAVLALPAAAQAWTKKVSLLPGVTYRKEVRWVHGGPLVTHLITAPRAFGLYDMKPVLAGGTVLGRERVTSMQRRLSRSATVAGVNGDFFTFATGHPNGIFMRDGVLATRPESSRSSLGVAFDGSLRVRRWRYSGSWQVDGFRAHSMKELNNRLRTVAGASLFTPEYGGRTPRRRRAVDVVLSGLPPTVVNGSLRARVERQRRGGNTAVPRGGGVIQFRGRSRRAALREALHGRAVTLRLGIERFWTDVADAIGGGPRLVRNGRPVYRSGEGFTRYQLVPRHPRTAVGQRANGRVMLVVADGRSRASMGVSNSEMALEMVRLGAVRAMGLDGGGSSTLAFDGRVLNRPSDGSERSVGDGLMVFYYGIYARRLRHPVVSPNGDGVRDVQPLAAKIVRRSNVKLRLLRPDGSVAWRHRGLVGRKTIAHELRRTRRNGAWRWVVEAVDMRGRKSRMVRRFTVNNTLGFLRLSKERMRVRRGRGGKLGASVVLTKRSSFSMTIRRASNGRVVRRLYVNGAQGAGTLGFRWDGRTDGGRVVKSGTYIVRAQARNELGRIALARRLTVVRVQNA
jgi:hypothetical protein